MNLKTNKIFNIPIYSKENKFFKGQFLAQIKHEKKDYDIISYVITNSIKELELALKLDKCAIYCNVECGNPSIRKNYLITELQGELILPPCEYKRDVEVSFVIISKRAISNSIKLHDVRIDYEIDKNQIMGYFPTQKFYIGNKITSQNFIEIQKSENNVRSFIIEENKLIISLAPKTFEMIVQERDRSMITNILMAVIIQPALTYLICEYCNDALEQTELYFFLKKKLDNKKDIQDVAFYVDIILNELESVALKDLMKLWRVNEEF